MSFPIRAGRSPGAGAVIALTACASNPVHYYTLVSPATSATTTATSTTARAAAPLAINVLPVGIPAQLDQQQMVVRSGTGAARILDNERWVAPLGDELRAALSSALVEQLGARNVTGLPRPSNQTVMSIRTQVRRFDAWPGSMAQFEADWVVGVQQNTPGTPARISCSTRLNEAAPGGYADMVRVQQRMIEQFATRIASTVRSFGNGALPVPPIRKPFRQEPSMGAREGIRLWEPATLKRCMTRDVLRAPPVSARRAPCPVPERAMERARIVEADVGADRRDRIGRIGQPLDRDVAPQFVLERLERRPFGGQVAAQRAHRAMQVLGRLVDHRQVGQRFRQVLPHAMTHELFAERFEDPVARCAREELAQVALLCRIGASR